MTRLKILLDDLTEDEAHALAQLCKRLLWDDFKRLSVNADEHQDMDRATHKLRRALAEAGIEGAVAPAALWLPSSIIS
jgi:hypothetical protein